MEDQEYLIHYGVKGMKWGVRKKRDTSSYSPERARFEAAKREKRAAKNLIEERKKKNRS